MSNLLLGFVDFFVEFVLKRRQRFSLKHDEEPAGDKSVGNTFVFTVVTERVHSISSTETAKIQMETTRNF